MYIITVLSTSYCMLYKKNNLLKFIADETSFFLRFEATIHKHDKWSSTQSDRCLISWKKIITFKTQNKLGSCLLSYFSLCFLSNSYYCLSVDTIVSTFMHTAEYKPYMSSSMKSHSPSGTSQRCPQALSGPAQNSTINTRR